MQSPCEQVVGASSAGKPDTAHLAWRILARSSGCTVQLGTCPCGGRPVVCSHVSSPRLAREPWVRAEGDHRSESLLVRSSLDLPRELCGATSASWPCHRLLGMQRWQEGLTCWCSTQGLSSPQPLSSSMAKSAGSQHVVPWYPHGTGPSSPGQQTCGCCGAFHEVTRVDVALELPPGY